MQPAIIFLWMLLAVATSAAQSVVPITQEPSHHLTISNRYVRVFEVEVPPHAETLYHQHDYDYLFVSIGDADITSTRLHEQPVALKLRDGQVEFSKGPFAHKATNLGDGPFRNVTIELLEGLGSPLCGVPGGQQSCGVGTGWGGGSVGVAASVPSIERSQFSGGASWSGGEFPVMRGSRVTVSQFSTQGNSEIPSNALPERPFLLIAISPMKFRWSSQNGTKEFSANSGDVFWNEAPELKFVVLPDKAKFLTIAFPTQKTQ